MKALGMGRLIAKARSWLTKKPAKALDGGELKTVWELATMVIPYAKPGGMIELGGTKESTTGWVAFNEDGTRYVVHFDLSVDSSAGGVSANLMKLRLIEAERRRLAGEWL